MEVMLFKLSVNRIFDRSIICRFDTLLQMGKHKEWRKIAKKERRRRIRKQKAQLICGEEENAKQMLKNDENHMKWLAEQEELELFKNAEIERVQDEANEKWLRAELIAQLEWRKLQDKISKARLERAEQDLRIKKEWDEQQKKIKEAEETRKLAEEEQLRCHNELMRRIEQFATGVGELPDEFRIGHETNPGKEMCPFFSKIGICRFGDNCSRNHKKPGVSKVLLAKNFYAHFGMEHSTPNEYDTDILLEYDDKDTYVHFKEFFNDIIPEFKEIGKIVQFKVCCNFERHLRGNAYIEYESLRDAVNAYRVFHGRWYGGKQISLQFCDVPSWNQAICGLFGKQRCPKGKSCNFLHVFRNPGDLYSNLGHSNDSIAHNESHRSSNRSWSRSKENGSNWRWSESAEPDNSRVEKKHSKSRRRRSPENRIHKEHHKKRDSRSPMRSRNTSSHTKRLKSKHKID